MTPRRRRLALVVGVLAGVAIAGGAHAARVARECDVFLRSVAGCLGRGAAGPAFRLGGMVEKGSVQRAPGSLEVNFVVTDFRHELPVRYTGVLPDLFREGQGVIAHGRIGANGVFVADEVLAKHDEKYMPPGSCARL
jgi:cytochrome c-type biogenesis protein CcmE